MPQIGVEHVGKGEQAGTLVLQRHPHRADASRVVRLAGGKLGDEEIEQLAPGGQVRTGESQNVVAQPVHKRADVTGEPVRLRLALPSKGKLGNELMIWLSMALEFRSKAAR